MSFPVGINKQAFVFAHGSSAEDGFYDLQCATTMRAVSGMHRADGLSAMLQASGCTLPCQAVGRRHIPAGGDALQLRHEARTLAFVPPPLEHTALAGRTLQKSHHPPVGKPHHVQGGSTVVP